MTKRLLTNICKSCGATFARSYSHQIYCSKKCAFEARLDKSGPCWLWTGGKHAFGYGQFGYQGKILRTHRFAHELYKGPIPDGLEVLHSCDVTACCNPDHLRIGDAAANAKDRQDRLRNLRKLTPGAYQLALTKVKDGQSINSVARELGVWQGSLYQMLKRRGELPKDNTRRGKSHLSRQS